jgi:DNA/RNA endonuclease YhcR with UshA esterase domain
VPHQGHFIARIPKSVWQNFSAPPEGLYKVGQTVQISGTLTWYQGAPQMIIETPQQIKIISAP